MSQEPHRDESKSAAPWFSPGLVESTELILRTVLDPDHLEPNGKLKPAAITLKDIQSRGWSVDRKKFTSLRQLTLFHARWKSRKPDLRRFYVLPVPVGDIRKPDPMTGIQDFVVVDSANWRSPAHAVILLSRPQTDAAARKFRNDLLKTLPPYVELGQAFGSAGKFGYIVGMTRQFATIFKASLHYLLRINE